MSEQSLTPTQRRLFDYIRGHQAAHGSSPSFEEMRAALDLKSKSGVHRMITALEERGLLRRLPNRARCLEIIKSPKLPDIATLAGIPTDDLAAEAKRRGLKLVHVHRDVLGNRSLVEWAA